MPDVEPGLYRHYKGNLYRVLFLARFVSEKKIASDEAIIVFVDDHHDLVACPKDEFDWGCCRIIVEAKNSTDGPTYEGGKLVVYVALYSDGRVSVRTLSEFTSPGTLDALKSPRFVRVKCLICNDEGFVLDGPDSDQIECPGCVVPAPLRNLDGSLKDELKRG